MSIAFGAPPREEVHSLFVIDPRVALSAVLLLSCTVVACANHPDQLARAELHYQQNRYRLALSNLVDLEHHRHTMSVSERVRYDVARGMAHLRLDDPRHARYWLSLAREEAAAEPTALTRSMRDEIDRVMVLTDPLAARDAGAPADASR
jgi:hypothetical protein